MPVTTETVPTEKKANIPLPVIALAFIIPAVGPIIGIVLLIIRLAIDNTTLFKEDSLKTLALVSWGLLVVAAGFTLFGWLDDAPSLLLLAGFMCVGGLCANFYSMHIKKKCAQYKRYIDLIVNQRVSSFDRISQTVGVPREKLVRELQKMIGHGYFKGAKINLGAGTITMPPPEINPEYAAFAEALQPYVVQCPGCGASGRVVPGEESRCEYCDSHLGK